ncbi:MAG TPA: hypothetical protein PKA90_11465 [Ignavibacteria bacterium]|nr:hypothetical protein [Ignavibacteria bacterium]HMR41037.1 hypothetical protein [Ignavibacteria bacterium]
MKYIIILLISISFLSCESNKDKNTSSGNPIPENSEINSNPIVQMKVRGMFEYKNSIGFLTDCESGKMYNVAEEGDVKNIDSLYNTFDVKNPKRKLYVIAEGFNSVKENTKKTGFDTVIVITRLLALDTAFNCQK